MMKNKQIQIAVLRAYARAYLDLQNFDWAKRKYWSVEAYHGLCCNSRMAANNYINREDPDILSCIHPVTLVIKYATSLWIGKTQKAEQFGYSCSYPIPLTAEQEAQGYSRGEVYSVTKNCYIGIQGFYRQSLAGFIANYLLVEALRLESEL